MRVILRGLRFALGAGVVMLALTLGAVAWTAARMPGTGSPGLAAPADAAIVLGAGVEGDGRLAYSSRRRVEGGVALLEAGHVRRLIFTGGVGGHHPVTPAASLMRAHAIALGADPAALLVEPRAVSTFENLRFSLAIARERGFERLVVVSDPWHLARGGALAAYWGAPDLPLLAAPGSERDWWPIQTLWHVREALAWWLNIGKVAGWEALALLGVAPEDRAGLIR